MSVPTIARRGRKPPEHTSTRRRDRRPQCVLRLRDLFARKFGIVIQPGIEDCAHRTHEMPSAHDEVACRCRLEILVRIGTHQFPERRSLRSRIDIERSLRTKGNAGSCVARFAKLEPADRLRSAAMYVFDTRPSCSDEALSSAARTEPAVYGRSRADSPRSTPREISASM